ncbi:uncharacterized protein Dana_GF26942, partial [Drosophila ananassae]
PVELKDSTKPDEKPKVPIVSETTSPREYSDDESDEDLDIPKPQDKPAGQPTPLITPLIGTGEKSPVKDDLKPQTVTTFKAEESLTTVQSAAKSVSTVVSITDSHVSDIKVPSKPEEKPQGPIDSVKPSLKEYSDDESDEDFDSSKPLDKQTPLIAPLVGPGEKSPVKTDEKPKPVELKDSTKPDEKPKVPIVSETTSPREYSDDESDEDLDIPKPQDKPAGQPTPLITPLIGTGEKSPVKDDLKPQTVTTFNAEESLTTVQSAAKS